MLRALLVGLVATFLAGTVAPHAADARAHSSSVKKHKAKAKRSAHKRKVKRSHKKSKRPAERRPLPP